ncbi:MAG: glucose-6-phosphate isomerase [Reyranellaceae bacterium]
MTKLPYTQIIDDCLADKIGGTGLSRAAFEAMLARCAPSIAKLNRWRQDGTLPLLRLPGRTDDLAQMQEVAADFRKRFANVVVLGTGGSSLGGQTLCALHDRGFGPAQGAPKLWFMDNVDPDTFGELFERLDPESTGFIAISKSGGTAETLTQLLIVLDWFEAHYGGEQASDHVLAITEPKDNVLRRLAQRHGIRTLEHDPGVGGRFSVLSLVGLIPAAIAGLDIAKVRQGAAAVLDATLAAKNPADSAPCVGAALSIALQRERGLNVTVLMPYVDRLAYFGMWYRQLWAESLGKNGKGTTPVRAMGTVDQHSQVQLYLDGPADKMFTVMIADTAGSGGRVLSDRIAAETELAYLAGRTMGDLLEAEARATAATFARNGKPVRLLRIPALDEESLGALLMHFMLETIIAADLLEVDAFDQPAVEQGKVLTRDYLGRMGG